VSLPGLGAELLEGFGFRDAATYESWLLSKRQHLIAASEAVLHEAALDSLSRGDFEEAIDYGVRAVTMNPYDENHQALLIRAYRTAGDEEAAQRQFSACRELLAAELGSEPGPAVIAALEAPVSSELGDDQASAEALLEAGTAAVAAGAHAVGIQSLRTAVSLADRSESFGLRVPSRLSLAEALIHAARGEDEEGSAILHSALNIAAETDDPLGAAQARVELGYVEFLRARYERAERWLGQVLEADGIPDALSARASTYLGAVESDRACYPEALKLLTQGMELAKRAASPRIEAYALSIAGRIHLLRGEFDEAAQAVESSIAVTLGDHWLAFLPWPQALAGEVALARNDPEAALEILQQAFARSCQLGDPCWEGVSQRGIALAAEAKGDTEEAFRVLEDARTRCNRLSDTYMWLDAYILDAQASLGLRHGHPDTLRWIDALAELASRTGMKELVVRALVHRAATGGEGDAEAARLLAAEIDSPVLDKLVEA
jgi:tetratricopeptide (TPR) repeat protein